MRPQRGPARGAMAGRPCSHDLAVSCVLPHSYNGAVQGDGIPSPDAVHMMAVNPLNEARREIGNFYHPLSTPKGGAVTNLNARGGGLSIGISEEDKGKQCVIPHAQWRRTWPSNSIGSSVLKRYAGRMSRGKFACLREHIHIN